MTSLNLRKFKCGDIQNISITLEKLNILEKLNMECLSTSSYTWVINF